MRALPVLFTSIAITLVALIVWICGFSSEDKLREKKNAHSASTEFSVPLATPDQSVALVQKWVSASSVSEFVSISRLLHLEPQEAYEQLQKTLREQGAVKRYKWLGLDQTLAVAAEKVLVIFESGNYRMAYLVFENDQWKVDLESFIGHHTKPWNEIIAQEPCDTQIRVLIQPDVYYNGQFDDESKWECLKMTQPDHEENLYGYVKRGSEAGLALEEISSGKANAPVILEISRKETMRKNQYEITKVIASGWLEAKK